MSITHNITQNYVGGTGSPMSNVVAASGESELNFAQTCNGSATTTLAPLVIMNPATAVQSCAFRATGDCTLMFDATSGTDVTVALAANTPVIRGVALSNVTNLPSGADTYTLKVQNAGSTSLTFEGRMVIT